MRRRQMIKKGQQLDLRGNGTFVKLTKCTKFTLKQDRITLLKTELNIYSI